jgi:hypothetical protein
MEQVNVQHWMTRVKREFTKLHWILLSGSNELSLNAIKVTKFTALNLVLERQMARRVALSISWSRTRFNTVVS